MINFIKNIFNKNTKKNEEVEEVITDKNLDLEEAIEYIQTKFIMYDKITPEYRQKIQSFAMSGDRESRSIIKDLLKDIIVNNRVHVNGYSTLELVNEVYARKYGLYILQKYIEDPSVDEIRVNRRDNIRIVREGIPIRVEEKFDSDEDVENAIKRMIMEDVGISLDKSSPTVESVLRDGSRLTAVCHPVSKTWNFILRKHDSFELTLDNYFETNTLNQFVWDRLSILARGGAKMLFSGNVGAGKTTLMKKVIGELDKNLRIGVIGTDIEVNLQEHYSDRDIIEFEEQIHLGVTMKELFNTMLRESIDVLVIEEFRGSGEAIEAVRACTRGLPNAFTTAHFNSPEETIEGTALFMLEEGLNLELDLAKLRVARAFNIIVQLFGDSISGKKRLISITEVGVRDNKVFLNDLVKWVPDTDDYFGKGRWVEINQPSKDMLLGILKRVSREEVERLGWDTSEIKF